MQRTQARRRRARRKELRRATAWAIVFAVELAATAAQTAIVAAVLLPAARAWRGYDAVGGEWLLLAVLFCAAYCIIHKQVCDKIFEEGKHG